MTSYTDTDLTLPGTKYHYRVSGINSGGTGAASDSVSGTTVSALPSRDDYRALSNDDGDGREPSDMFIISRTGRTTLNESLS